jgi:Cdc6-like AAA superfamily ATPase
MRKNPRKVPLKGNKKEKISKTITTKNKNQDTEHNIENKIKEKEEKNMEIEINDITEKLSNSTIYCRDKEKEKIISFIKSNNENLKTLFISGQPGTGKTSLVLEIFKNNLTEDKYFLKFYLNCISLRNVNDFYENLFKLLNETSNYDFFMEKLSGKEYSQLVGILSKIPNKHLFNKVLSYLKQFTFTILLDEIDFLYKKNDEYSFFELMSLPHLSKTEIKLILISNNSDFDNEIFPKLKNRNIQIEKIVFKPYTSNDLLIIMTKKLEEINLSNSFSKDSVKFLSSKLNKSGDIRPIIGTIKSVILDNKEEFEKGKKKIELKDMLLLIKKKNINLNEIISSMTNEQKIIVIAIYYTLKENNSDLEEKKIYINYGKLKNMTNTLKINLEEFREVLKNFCDLGLIEEKNLKSKKKGGNILYKNKYSEDELEVVFADKDMLCYFQLDDPEKKNK